MSRRGGAPPITLFSFQDIITSVMGIVILVLLILSLELISRELGVPTAPPPKVNVDLRPAVAQARALREELRQTIEQQDGAVTELAGQSATTLARQEHDLDLQSRQLTSELEALSERRERLAQARKQAESEQGKQSKERTALSRQRNELVKVQSELEHLQSSKRVFFSNPVGGQSKTPWLVDIADDKLQVAVLGERRAPTVFEGETVLNRQLEFLRWSTQHDSASEYFVLLVRPTGVEHYIQLETALRKQGFDVGLDLLDSEQVVIDPEIGAGAWESPQHEKDS